MSQPTDPTRPVMERFKTGGYGAMVSDERGAYVEFSAVESLLAEHERIKGENASLRYELQIKCEIIAGGQAANVAERRRADELRVMKEAVESRLRALEQGIRELMAILGNDAMLPMFSTSEAGILTGIASKLRTLVPTDGEKE
jgi:hypothetical protein